MSDNPEISVIVPCFNYAGFLKDCIASLVAQTFENWECIIVDDGSKDNTRAVGEELMKADGRVRYVYQENAGPSVARNNGLKNARGRFIQFLDADDLLEREKFKRQLAVFDSDPSADIVYGGAGYFRSSDPGKLYDGMSLEGSRPWMRELSGQGEDMIKALLNGNIMVISSPLVKKALFDEAGGFDERLRYNEDWELWARFAIRNAKFRFDKGAGSMALVRVHESYSKDNFMMYAHGLKACLLLNDRVDGREFKKIIVPRINYHMRIIDGKLMSMLRIDRERASREAQKIFDHTGIRRYGKYAKMFLEDSYLWCSIYSKLSFLFPKLKNMIVYS